MCRLSKDMEKNGDHYIASINTGNVQPNPLIKEKCTHEREMIKCGKNKMQDEDELPEELQHALHLSTSGSNANSTPPQKAAQSNNTSASSEGSLSSASTPAHSTIEHTRTTRGAHHHYANHLHLNTNSLNQHDNHDHHYHDRGANHHPHLNLEHHSHHDHDHHQNHIHAHADASLDSNGCISTHIFSGMQLLNGGGNASDDSAECATTPPFLLPGNATSWMASSSSASLEEPAFFSSSLVNGNVSTTPNDLSLMSTSMSKSTSTLHTHEHANQRTLSFLNNNMQFMEAGAGNFHQVPDASMMQMSDSEYAHYANVPTYSSFLAASPSCLQSEKASEHVDFLGASDGNGASGAECSMYQGQVYGEDDSGTFIQYQNASQAQNWHNVIHQEGHDGSAYACYWASTPQGMVQVMPNPTSGIGAHTPSYVFNAMELQQPEHYVYNAHQPGSRQGSSPMLPHSQSVPLGLDHFGNAHQSMNMGDQRVQITLNRGNAEGYGSSMGEFRGAVRSQLRKTKEGSSCSSIMELEDEGTHADHSWVDGHGAAQWRSGPHHMIKGMVRQSNKRPSPDGEEEESVHESAPALKRSASWDSMGVYSNKHTNSPVNDHHVTMNMNNMMKGSVSACKSTSPKQDKPRARQGIANDPQSIAARHRRERISERLKILQQLVPNGSKVDLVTMLEKAINYVKFLQLQVKVLATDEYWPTPLNKFPKVAAMAKLAADSKEPANLEKVEKALAETIQATS